MRHSTNNTTTNFPTSGLLGKGPVILVAALIVATTAGAIAANHRTRAVTPEVWKQFSTPAFILNLPGGYGVEDAVY